MKLANHSQFIFALFLLMTAILPTKVYAQGRGPIVVELFTSAGCPACPKADENFNALVNRPDVIALACHVTYFDRGKAKNTLSQAFCDARQGVYKLALGTGGVFTPMMVVDGKSYLTGSQPRELQKTLQNSANTHTNTAIRLSLDTGYLDIRLPQTALNGTAELWLIEYAAQSEGGYKNAITNFTKLMNWNGTATTMAFPALEGRSYAVIAQNYKTGIIASGKTAN